MTKYSSILVLVFLFVMPTPEIQAQKLKIPNLLPFKKQTNDVAPYQLSDGRSSQQAGGTFGNAQLPNASQNAAGGNKFKFPKMNLFKKSSQTSGTAAPQFGQLNAQPQNQLSNFNSKSKAFFGKLDRGLKKFGSDTKRALSDGWNPPQEKTAWWNQAPKPGAISPMNEWMQEQAERWPGNEPQPTQPYTVPRPRVANEYQNSQPRRRF